MLLHQPHARFWLTIAVGLVLAGCAQTAESTNPMSPPRPATVSVSQSPSGATAEASRTHVYIVNGVDPFHVAGLNRLADQIRSSGYPNTRYGGMNDFSGFEREIRRVHAEDPSAQFVLIGYSAGTLTVRSAANRLLRDGIPVAMLGYIGGDYLTDRENSRPPAVGVVVNVTGNGFLLTGRNMFWNGTDLSGASNERLRGVRHFSLPLDPRTKEALLGGLARVPAVP
jgi:hypothetical protein